MLLWAVCCMAHLQHGQHTGVRGALGTGLGLSSCTWTSTRPHFSLLTHSHLMHSNPLHQALNLMCNQLGALPAEIGALTGLRILGLKSNALTQLPDSFTRLTGLVELFITDNKLETLPAGGWCFAAVGGEQPKPATTLVCMPTPPASRAGLPTPKD